MKYESTMTSKGTVTVPAPLRKVLKLEPGQKIQMQLDKKGGSIIMGRGVTIEQLEKVRDEVLSKLPKRKPLTGKALKEAAARAWADGYRNE